MLTVKSNGCNSTTPQGLPGPCAFSQKPRKGPCYFVFAMEQTQGGCFCGSCKGPLWASREMMGPGASLHAWPLDVPSQPNACSVHVAADRRSFLYIGTGA